MRPIIVSVVAVMALGEAQNVRAEPGSALARAVSCRVDKTELKSLIAEIDHDLAGKVRLLRQYALPTGNLYRLDKSIAALGYTARDIYVQPGRIALVVDAALPAIAKQLELEPVPFGPASKPPGDNRSIVACQLGQEGLAGRIMIGCEYRDPARLNGLN